MMEILVLFGQSYHYFLLVILYHICNENSTTLNNLNKWEFFPITFSITNADAATPLSRGYAGGTNTTASSYQVYATKNGGFR